MKTWRYRNSGHRKRGHLLPGTKGTTMAATSTTVRGAGAVLYQRFRLHLDLGRLSSSLCRNSPV
jgi:hypothetical protein